MKKTIEQSGNPETPKYASVEDTIYTDEQKYVDPDKQYAHNDLYFSATVEVVRVEVDKVLVRDNTGDFWVPKSKLRMLGSLCQ